MSTTNRWWRESFDFDPSVKAPSLREIVPPLSELRDQQRAHCHKMLLRLNQIEQEVADGTYKGKMVSVPDLHSLGKYTGIEGE